MNTTSGISAVLIDNVVWMKLDGRGSFQNSPDLKEFANRGVSRGRNRFILDLLRCTGMDSTFMGTLRCVSNRLADADGWLHVSNAGGRNGESLRGLGLDQFFTVEDGMELARSETNGAVPPEKVAAALPRVDCTKGEQREICLEAHVALAEIDESNAVKFKDVITLMRQETESLAAH